MKTGERTMTDDTTLTLHGFEVRADTVAEKMTVQIRLRGSGHEWHTMTRFETSSLVDDLDSAIWELRKAEGRRRMPFNKRARYCELLKAHAQAPLDETDLAELRELHRGASIAGFDVLDELAAVLEPERTT